MFMFLAINMLIITMITEDKSTEKGQKEEKKRGRLKNEKEAEGSGFAYSPFSP